VYIKKNEMGAPRGAYVGMYRFMKGFGRENWGRQIEKFRRS